MKWICQSIDSRNHFSNSLMWPIARESGAIDGKAWSPVPFFAFLAPAPPPESFRFEPLGGMAAIHKAPGPDPILWRGLWVLWRGHWGLWRGGYRGICDESIHQNGILWRAPSFKHDFVTSAPMGNPFCDESDCQLVTKSSIAGFGHSHPQDTLWIPIPLNCLCDYGLPICEGVIPHSLKPPSMTLFVTKPNGIPHKKQSQPLHFWKLKILWSGYTCWLCMGVTFCEESQCQIYTTWPYCHRSLFVTKVPITSFFWLEGVPPFFGMFPNPQTWHCASLVTRPAFLWLAAQAFPSQKKYWTDFRIPFFPWVENVYHKSLCWGYTSY